MPRNDRSAAARADAAEPWDAADREPAAGTRAIGRPGPAVEPALVDGAGYAP